MKQLEASYEQHTQLTALRTVAFAVALAFLLVFAALALPQQQAQAATLTDGWEECGTCEWTISDGTLTIRPLGDGSTGTLGTKFGWTSTKKQSSFTKVVIESGVKTGASANGMFKYCDKVTAISGIGELDVSKATNMKRMFYGCYKLKKLDLSGWNTAKVTSMSSMFEDCKSLKKLDLSGWNTAKVKNMSYMFYGCSKLAAIEGVGKLKTSKATNMSSMFRNCKSLKKLGLSGWNTAKVKDMRYMFYGCSKLVKLNVSTWNTKSLKDMYRIFAGCKSLKKLNLAKWNTAKVKDIGSAFAECKSLKKLNLAKWNTKKVWCMYNVFANCKSLTTLNISGWSTAKVSDLEWFYAMGTEAYSTPNMFLGCTGLRTVKVGAAFSFETTGSTLPTPVKGSKKGKWKSSSGVTYSSPSKIPSNKKATYKAVF